MLVNVTFNGPIVTSIFGIINWYQFGIVICAFEKLATVDDCLIYLC